MSDAPQRLPDDWYPGTIPANVAMDPTAYIASSFGFKNCRSRKPRAVTFDRSSALYDAAALNLGCDALVRFGEYALMGGGALFCEDAIEIGPCSMIAWDTVVMDSYLLPLDIQQRRAHLQRAAHDATRSLPPSQIARPISIGRNVWISFNACILPGVKIDEGAVIAARAVVAHDVPANSLVAGNPARVVRVLKNSADGDPGPSDEPTGSASWPLAKTPDSE